ncbi:MAG: hypothetical protein HUN04_15860 [Desulfobacter sp.]|nr:MAG: hypothetical protein HUN04_15860 [Desulfobacter sp.]
MKTLTIKQNMIKSLDSDESKLEFANTVIALISGSEKTVKGEFKHILSKGLNTDIPEPMEGAPDFDSSNMAAPAFRRYSLLKAGYVPAGYKGLNCGYSGYDYRHLSTLSESEVNFLWRAAEGKLKQSDGKRDYTNFLKYLCEIYSWFHHITIIQPLLEGDSPTP